jgi:TonB family protein
VRDVHAFIVLVLVTLLLTGLAAAGVQEPGGNSGSVRITVQLSGNSESLSGIAVTLVPLPTPGPSTPSLPETEEAWLTYVQNPAPANLPLTVAEKITTTPAEARQKLAAALAPSLARDATIFEVTAGVSQPVIAMQVLPEYSDEARSSRVQGSVEAVVVVLGDGKVAATEITKSLGYGLDEKAVAAVKQWRFRPALKEGNPVPVYLAVSFGFNLRGNTSLRTVVTDTTGRAVFNNLEAGRYLVRGSRGEWIGVVSATVLTRTATDIVLPLKPAAVVGGVVSDSNGMPIPDARVTLGILASADGLPFFYPGGEVKTNSRGEYLLTAVGAGNYYLRAGSAYYPGTNDLGQATALPIRAGQDVRAVNFAVPK